VAEGVAFPGEALCFRSGCAGGQYFFFQAEDGIRDLIVTGVQTCALPIFRVAQRDEPRVGGAEGRQMTGQGAAAVRQLQRVEPDRSEERRVGKECRTRWSPDD